MELHANASAPKRYSFDLQAQPLLPAVLAAQGDSPAGTHHPVPR